MRLYTAIYLVGRVAKQSVDPDYVGLGWVRQRHVTKCRKVTLETIVTLCSRSWPQHATRYDLILPNDMHMCMWCVHVRACVRARACVCARVRVCVTMCVLACVLACVPVRLYDLHHRRPH